MSPTKPITKVLVANRGEIAVRVLRTCREMGLATVAIYSEVDRGSPHVRHADEAVEIGAAPPSESYLAIDRIVDAAKRTGADALHPGYGFLSERPDFARAVERAGLTFVGPGAETLEALALETAARRRMRDAGVPTVAGSEGPIEDEVDARAIAEALGFPVTIKPAAVGRAVGAWRCERTEDFAGLWRAAGRACAATGDGRLYLEKLPEPARRVEVQVLADAHGGAIWLGEREGSAQHRGRKVIEEGPSCAVDGALRASMGEVAVRAARAAGLVGAGTVAFLLDGQRRFHFVSMKARLSRAHAVTELLTGLDLVRMQLEVAQGGRVPPQDAVAPRGHAIQVHIHAEDPARDFAPTPGTIADLRPPGGPGVRDDCGVCVGAAIPSHYEPLVSRLSAWAPTRSLARDRLARALGEWAAHGVTTDVSWLAAAIEHPAFRAGEYDAGFLERDAAELLRSPGRSWEELALIAAAVAAFERDHDAGEASAVRAQAARSAWPRALPSRSRRGGAR